MSDSFVLCYHALSPTWPAPLSVTPEDFERQLSWLAKRRFAAVTFRELVESQARARTIAITFDDAFASVLALAEPILSSLGLPATVFAPTSFMSQRQHLRWPGIDQWESTPHAHELEGMSWDELGILIERGWEVGSHTHTHARLTQLDDDALEKELAQSREEAKAALGVPCTSIAYPYGDVDQRVAVAAQAGGYLAGADLSRRLERLGPFRWPRIGIYHADTFDRFRLKASRPMRLLRASRYWPDRGPGRAQ
jgi:peptidoglycan/xylan/chitin deacetylase (PgdA/CDA1 family)